MCGISCIINKKEQAVAPADIGRMTGLVSHRGPDGEGFYHYKKLALGHRRLSIIDLSEAGKQPMFWKDELVIIYNGEVYNYLEIRKELQGHGYHFTTQTDTEVILAAYHFWGVNCLRHFNGMWAIVILDKRNDTLFCSRDRFGVKPFYYSDGPGGFYIGSEIRQLLPFVKSRKIFAPALADYLLINTSDHTSDTFFESIKNLRGGHQLIYNLTDNSYVIGKWYTPAFHEDIYRLSEDDTIAAFETAFKRAIEWRLRSDVKVGTCLSGGLDSSYIAAIAAGQHNASNERFQAITAQSVEKASDETVYAKMMADQYRLGWNITRPETPDFLKAIDPVIDIQEEPFADLSVFMQHFVMKEAHEAGIVVLLDGQGADESLLGYPQYFFNYLKLQSIGQKPRLIKEMMAASGMGVKEVLTHLAYFTNPALRYKRQAGRMKHLKREISAACRSELSHKTHNLEQPGALRQLQLVEMQERSLPLLLRFEDKNAMHYSVEARLPFLDWQLMELVYSMSDDFRFKNGWSKYILRKALEKVAPPEIAWRKKKIGFVAPAASWLKNGSIFESAIINSRLLHELFGKKIPRPGNMQAVWKYYCLDRWSVVNDAHL
ncbi:MAG: asparagine synthase (glutamine-hydrolyzing) [Chitinophagaceae bacterium]